MAQRDNFPFSLDFLGSDGPLGGNKITWAIAQRYSSLAFSSSSPVSFLMIASDRTR